MDFGLNPGVYVAGVWLADAMGQAIDHVESAFDLEVVPHGASGLGATPGSHGLVATRFEVVQVTSDPVYSLTGSR
jgi:hypothetical protein